MTADLRSLAADIVGRAALEERFGPPRVSSLDAVLLEKAASADPELLKVAATFDTGETLETYEQLGGEYGTKEAVSPKWIADRVRSGAEKASPGRLKDFAAHMRGVTESPGVHGKNWLDYDQAATEAAEALARKK